MKFKIMQYRKAFTLLEVIIVIIIIGVLASLALPRLFAMVDTARAAEAMANIGTIRAAMERCYLRNNGTYFGCLLGYEETANTLDIPDPAGSPGAYFEYIAVGQTPTKYYICARRKDPLDGHSVCLAQGMKVSFVGTPYMIVTAADGSLSDSKIKWFATDIYRGAVPKE